MLDESDRLRVELLTLVQGFETYWIYYLQSGGRLYGDAARSVARELLEVYDELTEAEPEFLERVRDDLKTGRDLEDITDRLRVWSCGEREYPYDDVKTSRVTLWFFMVTLQRQVGMQLGLRRGPDFVTSEREFLHAEDAVRWSSHLSEDVLLTQDDVSGLIDEASKSETVVVMADIRHSQELMTHAREAGEYTSRMVEFIDTTRRLADGWGGMFDKFTGDGFLIYFNKAICDQVGVEHLLGFREFVRQELQFAQEHFGEWTSNVQKVPSEPIGLAIGADLGMVEFFDIDGQLIAVDDSIVWAARLTDAAEANQVLVNNRLYQRLRKKEGVRVSEVELEVKGRESMRAHQFHTGADDT